MRPGRDAVPDPESLGLYVHWPFCKSKCPYCDFNSHLRMEIDETRWRNALLAEIDHYAARTQAHRLESIFFGGGTPSLMRPETVAAAIAKAIERWRTADDLEITLEANPTSVEAGRLAAFREAGIGRLSLGVQSFDPGGLIALGREHGLDEAIEAIATAQSLFPRSSFDLIYARPGQTRAAWRDELDRALAHVPADGSGHLSVYQLTIEPGTAFQAAHRRGILELPGEDDQAAMFEDTQIRLEAAGLPAYEISNHAAPGQECRHNLIYWRSADYVGVGPGAHGRITADGRTTAYAQRRAPAAWCADVGARGHATEAVTPIPPRERLEEVVMMGLRLTAGLPRGRFVALIGAAPENVLDRAALDRLAEGGFVENDARGLRATAAGRMRLDAVLGALLA